MLNNLLKITAKRKKRIGRGTGSGRGAKSTRGTKRHQKAREDIKAWFEGGQNRLTKKYPLLRGKGINKSRAIKTIAIKLGLLNKLPDKSSATIKTLIAHNIILSSQKDRNVKIIRGGAVLTKQLNIRLPMSRGVRKEVEKKITHE